jgi:acyl transferase domain-containing protein/acyl carrier protein/UDP-glucose 4-epimerase
MVSVGLSLVEAEGWLEGCEGVSVAAVNGPSSVVVSGERGALDDLLGRLVAGGVRAREIPVGYASHSLQVDGLREELLGACEGVVGVSAGVPFFSTVVGGFADLGGLDGEYWFRNLRERVGFEGAVQALLGDGFRVFVEVSPHPVLGLGVGEVGDVVCGGGVVVGGSLRRDEGGLARFLGSLGELWVRGVDVAWGGVFGSASAACVELPGYAFQRTRYWLSDSAGSDMAAAGQAAADHPLLGAAVDLAGEEGWLFTARLSLDSHPWLADHAISGVVLLPGTALLELALRAGDQAGCPRLEELTLRTPLVLPEQGALQLQLHLSDADEIGRRRVSIHSRPSALEHDAEARAEHSWTLHASGSLVPSDGAAASPSLRRDAEELAAAWPPPGAEPVPIEELYDLLAQRGYDYGETFQALRSLWRRGEELFLEASLLDGQHTQATRFGIHPALLDAALHPLVAGLGGVGNAGGRGGVDDAGGRGGVGDAGGRGGVDDLHDAGTPPAGQLLLPFSWSDVSIHGVGASSLRARLAPAEGGASAEGDAVSVLALDDRGGLLLAARALALRPVSPAQLGQAAVGDAGSLFALDWVALPSQSAPSPAVGTWAVLGVPQRELAVLLARADVEIAEIHPDLSSLGAATERAGASVPTVVLVDLTHSAGLTHLAAGDVLPAESALVAEAHTSAERTLALLQSWLADERFAQSQLVLVTQRAVALEAGEPVAGLAHAAARGLVRSAQSEHPGRLVLVDLDEHDASPRMLAAALSGDEPELAVRAGELFVPRLARHGFDGALTVPAAADAWRLEIESPGTLENLSLVACEELRRPLCSGEVRVSVHAAGLNFRDVTVALGLLTLRENEPALGIEGAGTVIEVAADVRDLAPGDRVLGLLPGGFGPLAIVDRRLLAPIPGDWSYAQAASVPIAFLTAYHALAELALLRPGERLLVHAAAGGVGMAAVQIARQLGAEVYATASLAKWPELEALGLDRAHIASSRTLDFEQHFRAAGGGLGMDVVLNALAGEFVDASLRLLSAGGRFIEMGKTDIRDAQEISKAHPGVSYCAFDLLRLAPEHIQRQLGEVLELFARGALALAPLRSWPVQRAPQAFRHLSQGRNVGKLVLSMPAAIDPTRTVLITGGTGELGSLLARHLLTTHGARDLLLVSRRGADAAGARALEHELSELGARVTLAACDVSDRRQLAALIAALPPERPLGAVIHAAGALHDATLDALTPVQLERVLKPKLDAAWHLHELTAHMPLSAFVLFSSVAATLGNAGQGNYAAANAFLDALAAHRRAQGLVAVSMAWGLWQREGESAAALAGERAASGRAMSDQAASDQSADERAGMTAALSEGDVARLARAGVATLAPQRGLELFDAACAANETHLLPLRLDETGLRGMARAGTLPASLRALVRTPPRRSASGGSLMQRLAAAPESQRADIVLELVRAHAAAVLGHANSDGVDPQRAFRELGFDSLAAVELRNRLGALTGLRLATTVVFNHPTPLMLAQHLLEELDGSREAAPAQAVRAYAAPDEPIAIVGMSCRYPGGIDSPERLWQLVAAGEDAISGFPDDRGWNLQALYDSDPERLGTSYAREGGFISDAPGFDADFFGVSPREALAMDPQQRLLLELAWEVCEDAGILPASLRGSQTGVFAGISSADYGASLHAGPEGYRLTGGAGSVVSGRVAYVLGLQGPAVTIDTACSSSLVSMHLACQALRAGECSLALAGGVTVMATPATFVEFSRQRGLAPDGRCKAFAADADGTGFAEGAGLLLLQRLSDARRDGHAVLALLRGSAINQDGASNGLSAPNGQAQERVIAQALANARLAPAQIDAVEGHGTGTKLGDPIEAQALLATYGQERPTERPLWLGSIKSNIGHTQAAAGVAGVIKMAMAMRHGRLPRTLHADAPTDQVDWSTGSVSLLTEEIPWRRNGEPRRAGVSSFGISGTNAHVILEQAPPGEAPPGEGSPGEGSSGGASPGDELPDGDGMPASDGTSALPLPWVLSGRDDAALRAQALRLADHLRFHPEQSVADVGYSLTAGRTAFERRAVLLGSDSSSMLMQLDALAQGEPAPGVVEGAALAGGAPAFMFTGQGAQRPTMGLGCYASFPPFARALDEVCAALDPHLPRPLCEVLFAEASSPAAQLLHHTEFTQSALFALEVSLFQLLHSWGVQPGFLIGHSIGELSAAHVAGVISLADAAALVAARGRLMGALAPGGAMVSLQVSEAEALDSLSVAGRGERAVLAAVNGPAAVVVSGDEEAVLDVAAYWREQGRKTKRLQVSHAFHSPHMDAMLDDFAAVAEGLSYAPPRISIVSNLTGELLSTEDACSPRYWVDHVRRPVRFMQGMRCLRAQGVDSFIELGPDGVLSAMARECFAADEPTATALVPALRGERPEAWALMSALAELWVRGVHVDWGAAFADAGVRRVRLPTYAFQRERYWADAPPAGAVAPAEALLCLEWQPAQTAATALPTQELSVIGAEDSWLAGALRAAGITTDVHTDLAALAAPLPATMLLDCSPTDAERAAGDLPAVAHATAQRLLQFVQRWLAEPRCARSTLALITRGAIGALPDDPVSDLASAPGWGLLRSAQAEHPGRFLLIDLDGEESSLYALVSALAFDEPQLAVRDGRLLAPRLVEVPEHAQEQEARAPRFDPSRTVLITGGTSGLGALLARHLVSEHGARSILIASRRGSQADGAQQLQSELQALGAHIVIVACDVGNRGELQALLELVPGEHPLGAVLHAAATYDNAVLDTLTPEQLDRVLVPKLDAAWHLHELTEGMNLSAFVLFSSIAGILGHPGQGNYAAANVFLDALAAHRRARGLAGVSLAWGVWSTGAGERLREADIRQMARAGIATLAPEHGLVLFDSACALEQSLAVPLALDRGALRAQAGTGVLPYMLEGIAHASAADVVPVWADPAPALAHPAARARASLPAQRLASLAAAERERAALKLVRSEMASVLGHAAADALSERRTFKELGADSLTALELRNRLGAATGLSLSTTLVFDYPTPAAVARHIVEQLTLATSDAKWADEAGAAALAPASMDEPIAIVGMSCRYPGGVGSPEELWELLAAGADAISPFPEDRGWDLQTLFDPDPDRLGTSYTREGGFLPDAAFFDAEFFAISPREALAMDPQQRLLLEAAWEAFEDASISPDTLRGSRTGVFAGAGSQDYGEGLRTVHEGLEGHRLTGYVTSILSGRIAYSFGLEGPAMTIDTGCSASLVALHLACQALRSGECSLALAAGVTVIAEPGLFVEFSHQRGLARDGRCKSFAEAADGTGFAEGVGVLVVERLSDARRLGHRVLATVRGSAVNQDGASNGLAAPNGPAQQRVIRQALANAGLASGDIDAVEAHGTGTVLGDPIEAQALLATYGQERPAERPLWLGSVKSNIGHTQAAAGVAGVIKMVLAMRHGQLPRTLHVDEPSRKIDWSTGAVSLLAEPQPWSANGRPRRAGVSSFGISGTNAHVILEQAPQQDAQSAAPTPDGGLGVGETAVPWMLSAHGELALRAQAEQLHAHLHAQPDPRAVDIGYALATTRAVHPRRALLVGEGRADLSKALTALAQGGAAANLVEGVADAAGGGVVFVFAGQGSQWPGMALDLLDCSPVFAAWMQSCEQALAPHVSWSLHDVLRGVDGAPSLERIDVVQPALFAVMVSLAGLWRACGVEPDVVIGHSQGEIAAAFVAGGLSLEDAAKLIALRSRALIGLMGKGGMVSVALGLEEVEQWLAPRTERISVAAVNGPSSVVVSGERSALDELLVELAAAGVRAREIPVGYASHSPQVQDIRAELLQACAGVAPMSGAVRFYSTVTGEPLDTAELDGEYWYRNLRHTVRFEQAVRRLLDDGRRAFIEISPHPVLTVGLQEVAEQALADADEALLSGSLRRGQGDLGCFLLSLGEAWVRGVHVDWSGVFAGSGASCASLPRYAFQRKRYWLKAAASRAGDVASIGQAPAAHPLLAAAVELADGAGWLFTGRLSLEAHPWLADHAVMGVALLPGAAFAELALHAGAHAGCELLERLVLEAPLTLSERAAVQLQLTLGEADDDGRRKVEVHSRPEPTDGDATLSFEHAWTRHASGELASGESPSGRDRIAADDALTGSWPPPDSEPLQVERLYELLADRGYDYGPAFQSLTAVWRRGDEVFAEVALSEGEQSRAGRFHVHPALLDAALHAIALDLLDGERPQLPFQWSGVELGAKGATRVRARLRQTGASELSLTVADEGGQHVASARSLALRPVALEQLLAAAAGEQHQLFWLEWIAAAEPPGEPMSVATEEWAVLGGERSALATALAASGIDAPVYPALDALLRAIGETAAPRIVLADCAGLVDAAGLADGPVDAAGPADAADLADAAGLVDAAGLALAAHAGAHRALALMQGWLADERLCESRLVLVTNRAVAAAPDEEIANLAQAPLWGLVRSAQREHPGRFALLDLDEHAALPMALGALLDDEEPQCATRGGVLLTPQLVRAQSPSTNASARATSEQDAAHVSGGTVGELGTTLITGGTGGLGALLARHLVAEDGTPSLLLASRQGLAAPGALELQRELEALGARVQIATCDVGDRRQVRELLGLVPAEHPLRVVIHAAGALDDGVLESLTPEHIDRALTPKVDGALHLHELTAHLDLSDFVLFSAFAGTLGSGGQANYAAANTFLDALAAHRRAHGLPAQSLAWGLWGSADGSGGGALTAHLQEVDLARISQLGIAPLAPAEIPSLFDAARAGGEALTIPVRLDRAALCAQAISGTVPALLRGLLVPRVARFGGSATQARQLAGMSDAQRRQALQELVRAEVAAVLGLEAVESVEMRRAFKELGFDSLGAVALRNRLAKLSGLTLPATLVFDHPTPQAVVDHLLQKLAGARRAAPVAPIARRADDEPIAIVGMGCRYPGGVRSPQDLWELVRRGGDAISGFPDDRGWELDRIYHPDPAHPGTSYAREGGFLRDAGDFDAGFFGISPREALATDPQQRQLLEVSWQALEDAGLDPLSLRGSQTGVFAGLMYHDYTTGPRPDVVELEGYLGFGNSGSVVSGRVAYTFGLEGPAVTVDTACSSSLVALHLACQALRAGECSLALAGGVTVMATPWVFVETSRQRGLAPDGRCKAFADAADGAGFAEGVGVLVVERLSDARRLGHRVLATVRGSAVNQDGASNGLAAPNGPAQQRVIAQALANADLSAGDVDAVEAHGTGTALGDPIEAQALLATYGQERPAERPLWLGSIKSNIGHTQAAAGVAGVIKMVMAMRHGILPRTLHVDEPSREVDWSAGAVSLLTETQPWPANGHPRRVGISSFGVSGTNAHLLLEDAPQPVAVVPATPPSPVLATGTDRDVAVPWLLSGRGVEGLRAQAAQLLEYLEPRRELSALDVALSLAIDRPHLERRAVVVGDNRTQLLEGVAALARGESHARVASGVVDGGIGEGGMAFVFPGQGGQWVGMGVELWDACPVFAEWMRACELALAPFVDWSLESVLRGVAGAPSLDRLDVVQPVLFAVMVSLAALWRACGVEPGVVVGHSQGEIAAACVAGGLSLDDAMRLVALRSRALLGLIGKGAIASVRLSEDEVVARLEGWGGRLSVSAVNGPSLVGVAGDVEALDAFCGELEEEGVRVRRVAATVPTHSVFAELIRDELLEACGNIAPQSGDGVEFYSTVTGGLLDMGELGAEYWYRNVRERVRFQEAVEGLLGSGFGAFVEVGPHPVMTFGVQEMVDVAGVGDGVVVAGSLRRGEGGLGQFLRSLAEVWVRGVGVDWVRVFDGSGAASVGLPGYAFQRTRYWLEPPSVPALGATSVAPSGRDGDAEATPASEDALLRVNWQQLPAQPAFAGRRWAALGSIGALLAQPLETAGIEVRTHADLDALRRALDDGLPASDLALLDCRAARTTADANGHLAAAPVATARALTAIQTWLGDERLAAARLVLVTGGAVSCVPGEDPPDPVGAAVWGLVRTVQSEHPGRLVLVDLDETDASRHALAHALAGEEWQLAVRKGEVLVPRLARCAPQELLDTPADTYAWRLDILNRGTFENLMLRAHPDATRSLAPGEVRVAVRAAGVNFHDVADSLGLLPDELSGAIGLEGAGIVLEVAHDVTDLAVGECVMGLLPGAFGPLAVADRHMIVRMPAGLSFAQAAALPVTFLAAYRGLVELADLQPGESIVIHAASGGVGTMAVRLARHLGAEVFATASPAKWSALQTLGVDDSHIASSRTPRFREQFLERTGGRGVDVVLNCLTRELVDASLALLPRGGRFLELGKADIRQSDEIAQQWPGVSYIPFDLNEVAPERIQEMLCELVRLFETDALQPPPITTWDVRRARQALRFLRQARHVGKVVLSMPSRIDSDGTVLVTGAGDGTGGLLARHLVTEHGVRSVLLAQPRDWEEHGLPELCSQLETLGARVTIAAYDPTDREDLERVLALAPADYPLRAIVHAEALDVGGMRDVGVAPDAEGTTAAAGALHSDVAGALDSEGTLAARLATAWHLHAVSAQLDLSAFVLCSSTAGTLGAAGQGHRVAAAAFLDALAEHRRCQGLPGISLAWELWSTSSADFDEPASTDETPRAEAIDAALSAEQGLALFDAAFTRDEAALVSMRLDVAALRERVRTDTIAPLLRDLVAEPAPGQTSGEQTSFEQRLIGLTQGEREQVALDLVLREAASVLGHDSPQALEVQRPFKELGFDSLAAVELRNRLGEVTGLRLPSTLIFSYPTPVAVARHLLSEARQVTDEGSVEAELDRLESMLSALAPKEARRTGIAARLQALAAGLAESPNGGSGSDDSPEDVADMLRSASAEQVLSFIDEQINP